jgi:hypothetical protein
MREREREREETNLRPEVVPYRKGPRFLKETRNGKVNPKCLRSKDKLLCPVLVQYISISQVRNFGTGISPFFLLLAPGVLMCLSSLCSSSLTVFKNSNL